MEKIPVQKIVGLKVTFAEGATTTLANLSTLLQ